jgi:hypothetical protein
MRSLELSAWWHPDPTPKLRVEVREEEGKREMRKAKKSDLLDAGAAHATGLAKARNECCCLRNDLARLGQLTKNDRLWMLLVEKEQELLDAELADLRQFGEGSAKWQKPNLRSRCANDIGITTAAASIAEWLSRWD